MKFIITLDLPENHPWYLSIPNELCVTDEENNMVFAVTETSCETEVTMYGEVKELR